MVRYSYLFITTGNNGEIDGAAETGESESEHVNFPTKAVFALGARGKGVSESDL